MDGIEFSPDESRTAVRALLGLVTDEYRAHRAEQPVLPPSAMGRDFVAEGQELAEMFRRLHLVGSLHYDHAAASAIGVEEALQGFISADEDNARDVRSIDE